jgi:hypothetical protein
VPIASAWEVSPLPVVQRRPRSRGGVLLAGVATVMALVVVAALVSVSLLKNTCHLLFVFGARCAVLAVLTPQWTTYVQTSAGRARTGSLLSMNSWAWGDQPMQIDPMSAAVQAASLASVAKQGYLVEQHKLAKLRMVQVSQLSGALNTDQAPAAKKMEHSVLDKAFLPKPFSDQVAQRLQAVDGAAEGAQKAAAAALEHGNASKLWSPFMGSYLASPKLALPTRTTRNGLALDYFHLNGLPAATAVRLAKREVAGAMARPAKPSPGLLDVDAMAKQAFEEGTSTVVSRRQKAGILPMPINKGWNYSMKEAKAQVGEKVAKAQQAVERVDADAVNADAVPGKDDAAEHAPAAAVAAAAPAKSEAASAPTRAAVKEAPAVTVNINAGSGQVQDRLGKLEAEVKRLKEEKAMVDKLDALKVAEAKLESNYPQLTSAQKANAVKKAV